MSDNINQVADFLYLHLGNINGGAPNVDEAILIAAHQKTRIIMKIEDKYLLNVAAAHRLLGTVRHSDSAAGHTNLGSNSDNHIDESGKRVTLGNLSTLKNDRSYANPLQ